MTVLGGQVPDLAAVSTYELVGYNSKSFENNDASYKPLMDAIRRSTDCVCMWEPVSNAVFLESAYPANSGVENIRQDSATVTTKTVQTSKGPLQQVTKIIDNVHTVWEAEHWCKNINDVDRALSVPYEPLDYDFSDFARIKAEVSDNGIIMSSLSDPLWMAAALMNFGDYTIWAMTETEHFARTVDAMHERCMENLKRMLDMQVVDLYRICGPEYATEPYLPPALFKRFVAPYVKDMTDLIHSRGAKVRLHCHGRINKVLDMIVETDCDAIDPCEAPPDGDIELAEVKKRIGDSVCLFGNIQLKLLENGTTEEVRQAVIKCMDSAKAGGRYVIMPTAAPINVPLAKQTELNYMTFIDAALQMGKY
jgi:hypothetical protein